MVSPVGADLDIIIEPAAREFCREQGLEGELKQAIDLVLVSFNGTERLSLSMMEDPYDQEAEPTIVAELQSPLPRREFRDANSRFFRTLREEGCVRFHRLLAVLQE